MEWFCLIHLCVVSKQIQKMWSKQHWGWRRRIWWANAHRLLPRPGTFWMPQLMRWRGSWAPTRRWVCQLWLSFSVDCILLCTAHGLEIWFVDLICGLNGPVLRVYLWADAITPCCLIIGYVMWELKMCHRVSRYWKINNTNQFKLCYFRTCNYSQKIMLMRISEVVVLVGKLIGQGYRCFPWL